MTKAGDAKRDLTRELIEIVAREAMIDPEKLTLETPLADLDIQSADYVMILMSIEQTFDVYIPVDTELTEARTVGDLMRLVEKRVRDAGGRAA